MKGPFIVDAFVSARKEEKVDAEERRYPFKDKFLRYVREKNTMHK